MMAISPAMTTIEHQKGKHTSVLGDGYTPRRWYIFLKKLVEKELTRVCYSKSLGVFSVAFLTIFGVEESIASRNSCLKFYCTSIRTKNAFSLKKNYSFEIP